MSTSYTPTAEAIAFFLKHGAPSYFPARETEEQGRQRSALEAAQAECLYLHAHQVADVVLEWEPDGESMEMARRERPPRRQPLFCALLMHVNAEGVATYLAGLHGIDDDRDTYRRVVRAELAQEAADELRAIIAAASEA